MVAKETISAIKATIIETQDNSTANKVNIAIDKINEYILLSLKNKNNLTPP